MMSSLKFENIGWEPMHTTQYECHFQKPCDFEKFNEVKKIIEENTKLENNQIIVNEHEISRKLNKYRRSYFFLK